MNAFSSLFLLLILAVTGMPLQADEDISPPLTISDPYIEMRTGPGNRYPIFNVEDRGKTIRILQRKTNWFQVQSENGKQGWVHKQQMQNTLLPSGSQLQFSEQDRSAFEQRKWEIGALTGEIKNAPLLSVYGGYAFTKNISLELELEHSVGNVSSSDLARLSLLMQPFPEWKYSPFFTLGAGAIQVKPNATLIDPADRNNALSQVGFGLKTYLARRFVLRLQLNQLVIFSANNEEDQNEELTEWKIGFAIFF